MQPAISSHKKRAVCMETLDLQNLNVTLGLGKSRVWRTSSGEAARSGGALDMPAGSGKLPVGATCGFGLQAATAWERSYV